jgi:putative membrane protein
MKIRSASHKSKIGIVLILLFLIPLSWIGAPYPHELLLQHLGTLVLLIVLFADIRKDRMSHFAFLFYSLFVFFHILGARYIYSCVPYNDWIRSISGIDLAQVFQTDRNHYDRFVHLIAGILLFPWLYELFRRRAIPHLSILLAWAVIQSFSLFYEVFEWILTLVMSADAAENYNGQQGDAWDAQKDMALALIGSSLMALIYRMTVYSQSGRKHQE